MFLFHCNNHTGVARKARRAAVGNGQYDVHRAETAALGHYEVSVAAVVAHYL